MGRLLITMHKSLYFLAFITLFSCSTPKEAPVFKRVSNVKVTNVKGNEASLSADAYFFNPNNVAMKLRQVEVDIIMKDKTIGSINHELKTHIPANAEFKVPVDAIVKLDQLGTLNSILGMLGTKKIKVRYTGYVKVTVNRVPIKVKVDSEEEIRF